MFVKEDRRRTHEGEVAGGGGVAHLAVIFSLGVVAPVMLFNFNPPILSYALEQQLGRSFFGPETGHSVNGFMSRFVDPAFAEELDYAIDAKDLRGSGQPDGRPVNGRSPEVALFNPTMALIGRLSLRGGYCPAVTAGLWPAHWAGCL